MIKITHSNMCSKSRDSLEMLRESGVDFEIINYLSGELSKYDISNILVKLKMTAEQITRKTETLFKKKFKNNSKDFSEEEWVEMLVDNPSLIERPIIWDDKKAVVGRPPENVKIFL